MVGLRWPIPGFKAYILLLRGPFHAWWTVVSSEGHVLCQAMRTLAMTFPAVASIADRLRYALDEVVLELFP